MSNTGTVNGMQFTIYNSAHVMAWIFIKQAQKNCKITTQSEH